jgi:hypothetical protein
VTNTGGYSEILLGTAPIYWLFRFLTLESDTSFQLWLMSISLLNYTVAFLFLRRLFRFDALPSAMGGFIFAFASVRVCQMGHEQLFPQFWTVLTVWAVFESLKDARYLYSAFACLVLQFYSGFYLGWFLAFGIYITTVYCLIHPTFRSATVQFLFGQYKKLILCTILSLLALSPMAYHYFLASQVVGPRSFGEVEAYAPHLESWFYLGKFSWLYRWEQQLKPFARLGAPHEQRLGLGIVTLGIVVYSLIRERKKKAFHLFLFVSLCIILLATRFSQEQSQLWYYVGYKGFPGGISIRTLSRIAIILLIPAAVAIAAFFQKYRGRWAILLIVLVLLEQGQSLEYFDKAKNRSVIDMAAEQIPLNCRSFYFVAQGSNQPDFYIQEIAMWASMKRGVPTINGYSGSMPPGWNFPATWENPLNGWLIRNNLTPSDVCVVHGMPEALPTLIYP